MAKNGLKMVEIFWWAPHMIDNNISTFLVFKFLVFGYFTNPVFWPNLEKIALKTRSRKYQKENVKKPKMLKCYYLSYERPPPKKFNHF